MTTYEETDPWTCRLCGETKQRRDFDNCKKMPSGKINHCKACRKEYNRKRHAARGTCSVDGCDRKEGTAGLCTRHYREERYGDCQRPNCTQPAEGPHGFCTGHVYRGPCEEKGCKNPGRQKVDGVLVCYTHYGHRTGKRTPREEGWADKPHFGYIVEDEFGYPAYVGITHNTVATRMQEHRQKSDWFDERLVMPTEAVAEFENEADAKEWEQETIRQLVDEGHLLFNMDHNREQYNAVRDVILEELADLIG